MKNSMRVILISIFCSFSLLPLFSQSTFETLPLNEIKVEGWMKKQLNRDISEGYISKYDELQPTMKNNVFGPVKAKNYSIDKDGNWIARRETWWPGEHEGYFADIVVRSAFLTGNEQWLKKAKLIVDNVVENQDVSGYIGIYDEECRLDNILNENGEFWTQSRILGALLAYYEYSGEKKYYDAAKRAIDYTIKRYVDSGKSYFHQPNPNGGGLTHGLMLGETLEWFYKISGDKKYLDFAKWLYEDYSTASEKIGCVDNQLEKLKDREKLHKDHGVHVCEGYRVPLFLATNTNDVEYKQLPSNLLYKISRSLNPSGSAATDRKLHESIGYNYGSPDLPTEYCIITELLISFSSALSKLGDPQYGDLVENLTFNAAQAARLSNGKAIAYLSSDNQYSALGQNNFRYQYAACHRVACCNLQAGKIVPYYAANMWMKSKKDRILYATLLGASEVNTKIGNSLVSVKEITNYPFENNLKFIINVAKPIKFTLAVRNPKWSLNTNVNVEDADVEEKNGFIYITKVWKSGDEVSIDLDYYVYAQKAKNNEFYFKRGPLMYSLPIENIRQITQDFGDGLENLDIMPKDMSYLKNEVMQYKSLPNIDVNLESGKVKLEYNDNPNHNNSYPFDVPYGTIKVPLLKGKEKCVVEFVPIGSTILRKSTFAQ